MDVCVIGAGVCGILMLRHLKDKPEVNRLVAFEQCPVIGGQWAYTDQTGPDVVSSIYKDMQ